MKMITFLCKKTEGKSFGMKRLVMLFLVFVMSISSVSVAYASEDVVVPGTYKTEYGYRYISQETVEKDAITAIVDVYYPGTDEEYAVSSVYGMNGSAVYNSKTGELTENNLSTKIEVIEYVNNDTNDGLYRATSVNTKQSPPTSIDHPFKFKTPDWGYIRSSWIKVTSERLISELETYGIMALINAICPPLGITLDIALIIKNVYLDEERLADNAFWMRKYTYGYAYVLNQTKVLVQQYYDINYGIIEGAWHCDESALA